MYSMWIECWVKWLNGRLNGMGLGMYIISMFSSQEFIVVECTLFFWFYRKLVERLESLKSLASGNGITQCILCGDSFGLSVFGRNSYRCKDCKKVSGESLRACYYGYYYLTVDTTMARLSQHHHLLTIITNPWMNNLFLNFQANFLPSDVHI